MPRLRFTLPVAAAALTLLWAATAVPAHADRGDRGGARQERSDRSDRHDRSSRHDRGRWGDSRGAVVVRPGYGAGYGAGYGHGYGAAYRPAVRSAYGPAFGPVYRPAVRDGWGRPIARHHPRHYPRHYPRHGLVIDHRPALWTLVTVGALSYIYADGVYYREHNGGYQVVAPPEDDVVLSAPPAETRYVYPRQNQSAERQANDEYECHRWAVQQTGFDPSSVAMGTARNASAEQRAGYPRARDACLEGRGYSLR